MQLPFSHFQPYTISSFFSYSVFPCFPLLFSAFFIAFLSQMNLQNFMMSKNTFHISFFLILFTTLVHKTLSIDPKFEACVPRNCGEGPNISFPFWITNEQESFCGCPKFKITCNNRSPVLAISNDDYVIRDIFYSNQSVLVANSAVYDDTCPTPLHNFSLDRTPFNYSPSHMYFFIFYNCTSEPIDYGTFPVECASNATSHSFAAFHKELLEYENYSTESCQSWVNAPVDWDDDGFGIENLLKMNYTGILKMGFLLNWTENNCSNCQTSGGHCGYENNEFICFCRDGPHLKTCDGEGEGILLWFKLLIGIGGAIVGILLIWISICCFRRKVSSNSMVFWRGRTRNDQTIEAFIRNYGSLAPKRYTYSEVKKLTSSFKDKLGQGGYGNVYKGKLINGYPVAVKVLKASKGNGEEFINEVASISRTSHVNVVTLLGFCIEGHTRALIYEFMPNGSLEKFIYNENPLKIGRQLGWEKLQQIATGIARGLEYLHRGCNTRILHFDIKPHNILLDEAFCPKISDFGLAKLCSKKESIISMLEARGTIGYIAPEVFSRNFGAVSHKSDVYSYGMMVLEMVGGRNNINVGVVGASHTSEIYFPHWIYKRLELDNNLRLQADMSEEDNMIARKMVIVGLWCIQTDPSHRPSMSEVMNMLEGSINDLQIPPKPYLSSPPRSPANPSTFSTVSIS